MLSGALHAGRAVGTPTMKTPFPAFNGFRLPLPASACSEMRNALVFVGGGGSIPQYKYTVKFL